MNASEKIVVDELAKHDLLCDTFSKEEMTRSKTPDFRVYQNNAFAFFCEVKEIAEDSFLSGLRPDPIFNRLTDDIHTATKQFNSVNPDFEHPNVLAFVNNDHRCGSLDLVGVITGHLLTNDGGAAPIYLKYSEGRIKAEKHNVHLYLWCDSFKENKILFNTVNAKHFERLCGYFKANPKDIRNF